MKEFDELNLPGDLRYSDDHEWSKLEDGVVRIGVTDYAQDQLGDIVFVEMPEVGETFDKGDEFGTLESVKAVSELYLPIGGEVVAINEALIDAPELINSDPYANWIVALKPVDAAELDELLDVAAYSDMIKG